MRCDEIDKDSLDNFIIDLQKINPHSECMWQLLLAIEYEDFELSQDHSNLIKSQVGQLLDNITPAEPGPVLITSSQGNAAWHNERRARVIMRGGLGSPHRMPRPYLPVQVKTGLKTW